MFVLILRLKLWLKLKLKPLPMLKLWIKLKMKPLLGLEEKLKQVRAAVSAQVAMLEDMLAAKLMLMQLLLVAGRQGSMPVLELVVMQAFLEAQR
jgi:hypothetical protein